MNHLIIIGLVVAVIASLVLMNNTIDNQQDLEKINTSNQEIQSLIITESISLSGFKTNTGSISLSNTSNEDITMIQIRVYDDNGNFVKSFDIDEIISSNTDITISDLPLELQEMMSQWIR